jgi:hypothetical protein
MLLHHGVRARAVPVTEPFAAGNRRAKGSVPGHSHAAIKNGEGLDVVRPVVEDDVGLGGGGVLVRSAAPIYFISFEPRVLAPNHLINAIRAKSFRTQDRLGGGNEKAYERAGALLAESIGAGP